MNKAIPVFRGEKTNVDLVPVNDTEYIICKEYLHDKSVSVMTLHVKELLGLQIALSAELIGKG